MPVLTLRWFAPHAGSRSIIPSLGACGIEVREAGDGPADLALAMGDATAQAGWDWSRLHRVPLILYLWDLPPWAVGRGGFNPVFSLAGRLITLPRPNRSGGRGGHFSRVRWIARRAREIWVPSGTSSAAVQKLFGVASRLVPYGVDTGLFGSDPGQSRDRLMVVCPSPLLPHGNHAALIRAAARSSPKLKLRFLNGGPEQPGLELLASDLGVDASFDSGADPAIRLAAFRAAGAVVCSSRYEGFGAAALEALATGAPVVASDIPSHREVLG
ncbi:MAG: glycosyltransferase family 4 protein, partial [Gemmatimonadota bacterium]